jgi:dTDP-4-dehydrorhamnose reductase
VVDDQQGRPTWARDVALAATAALDAMHLDGTALGILHAAGGQDTSWADFATMIFAEQARRGRPFAAVRRIGTQDYPTSARRPRNSRLETARAQAVLGWRAAPLPDAISTVLDQLEHTP